MKKKKKEWEWDKERFSLTGKKENVEISDCSSFFNVAFIVCFFRFKSNALKECTFYYAAALAVTTEPLCVN